MARSEYFNESVRKSRVFDIVPILRFLITELVARLPQKVLEEMRASQQLPEEEEVERSYIPAEPSSEITLREDFVRAKARRS